jgi:hypothetical protein
MRVVLLDVVFEVVLLFEAARFSMAKRDKVVSALVPLLHVVTLRNPFSWAE